MTSKPVPALGRLAKVELRNAWEGEATHFSPWLAQPDNITLLGESIGIELEVEGQEQNVGPFRADILCRDTINNHWVLIENQLEKTDHSHLGQLLTYTAGLEAVTIVWIASRFTEEHRAALDWLNNATNTGINFFGLEIELWRIGDSAMAPKFNVVSKPNDWNKTVREQASGTTAGQLSDTQQLHLDYWTQFRDYVEETSRPFRISKPSKDHWTIVAVGRTDFALIAWNGMRDNRSGVHLRLTGPDAKAHFQLLKQQHQVGIEEELSLLGEVHWRLIPDAKESQVAIYKLSTKPTDPTAWPALNKWMADTLEAMDKQFRPLVKQLNAAEYVPAESGVEEADEEPEPGILPIGSGE